MRFNTVVFTDGMKSVSISAVFNVGTGGTIRAIAPERPGSSMVMLILNFGLGEG